MVRQSLRRTGGQRVRRCAIESSFRASRQAFHAALETCDVDFSSSETLIYVSHFLDVHVRLMSWIGQIVLHLLLTDLTSAIIFQSINPA